MEVSIAIFILIPLVIILKIYNKIKDVSIE